GVAQVVQRIAGEHRVGAVGNHMGGAALLEGGGSLAEGAGGVDHVVHQDAAAPLHLADDMHHLGDIGGGAALVDDGQVGVVELLGDGPGAYHAADIGGDHHRVVIFLPQDVVHQYRRAVDVVHRLVEEALDL